MMIDRLRKLVPVLVLAAGIATWAACKQQEGDRCQITADCEDGLTCNEATQECTRGSESQLDARVPDIIIDAPTAVDAGVDAPDAAPDAAPAAD